MVSFLTQVTIVPKLPWGGFTHYEPYPLHVTPAQLRAWLVASMGGRAAEEIMLGPEKITSGASTDIQARVKAFAIVCG